METCVKYEGTRVIYASSFNNMHVLAWVCVCILYMHRVLTIYTYFTYGDSRRAKRDPFDMEDAKVNIKAADQSAIHMQKILR